MTKIFAMLRHIVDTTKIFAMLRRIFRKLH